MITTELSRDSSETKYHDRYLISNKNVWNVTSSDIIEMAQRADIVKLENQETIDADIDRFETVWNSEKNYEINGKKNDVYKKLERLLDESEEKDTMKKRKKTQEEIVLKTPEMADYSFYK